MDKIDLGIQGVSGSGNTGREGGDKINKNFVEVIEKLLGLTLWNGNTSESLDLSGLNTSDKSSMKAAINEVLQRTNVIDDSLSASLAKTYSINGILNGNHRFLNSIQVGTGGITTTNPRSILEIVGSFSVVDPDTTLNSSQILKGINFYTSDNDFNPPNTNAGVSPVVRIAPYVGADTQDKFGIVFYTSKSDEEAIPVVYMQPNGSLICLKNSVQTVNSDSDVAANVNVVKVDNSQSTALTITQTTNVCTIKVYSVTNQYITFVAGTGVNITIVGDSTNIYRATLEKIGTNEWIVSTN